jgi:hypothetical protein
MDLPFTGRTCQKCGYNLTGLDRNRCPECGTKFDPHVRPSTRINQGFRSISYVFVIYPLGIALITYWDLLGDPHIEVPGIVAYLYRLVFGAPPVVIPLLILRPWRFPRYCGHLVTLALVAVGIIFAHFS